MRHLLGSGKRRGAILGLVAALLTFAGIGMAAWLITGSGAFFGQAASGITAPTVVGAAPATAMYPGGNGDIKASINNPNAVAVRLDANTTPPTITNDKSGSGCVASSFTWNQATVDAQLAAAGAGLTVAANAPAGAITLTGALSMSSAAGANCYGAVVTVTFPSGSLRWSTP